MELDEQYRRILNFYGPEHLSLKVQNVEFDINVP